MAITLFSGTLPRKVPQGALLVAAVFLLAATAGDAAALSRLGPELEQPVPAQSAESGTVPRVILAGSRGGRSASRSRGAFRSRSVTRGQVFRSSRHYPLGSRHLRRAQRVPFKGNYQFNVPRYFRGRRDFSAPANIGAVNTPLDLRNPKIVNSRSLPLLRGQEFTRRSRIPSSPNWFGRGDRDDSRLRVLRGQAPGLKIQPGSPEPGQTAAPAASSLTGGPAAAATQQALTQQAPTQQAQAEPTLTTIEDMDPAEAAVEFDFSLY